MSEQISTQKQLFRIIESALSQPEDQRTSWLKQNCSADQFEAAIRLLGAAESATLGVTAFDVGQFYSSSEEHLGHRIGAYRLTELIGEGGMGLVYRGKRDDGAFDHQVAIKLIRLAIADESIVRRFELERQILSNLQHPNIAMLHDGGTTEQGVPYLVMEYVDGTPIDEYITQQKLSVEQILKLFVKITSAVHSAHQALVIHRDIKPANILVDQDGEPKLLDFGIARSLDPVGSKNLEKTQIARLTPSYASPEQIRNESLTTATDVYSLGVVLYEALTGQLPYEVTGLSAYEAEKIITGTVALRPTLQMIERHGPRARLRRGELDAIVLKALSTDPERRYDSAGALMDDLSRYLKGLPVEARLDTPLYRLRKLVARHRAASLATAAAVLALFGGLTASLIQTQEANKQLARAEAVGEYLRNLLLSPEPSSNNAMQLGPDARISDLLAAAERQLDTDLSDQPEVRIELYNTIGTAQMWMNDMDAALRTTRKAVKLASSSDNQDDSALVDAIHALGTVLDDDDQFDAAIKTYQEAQTLADSLGVDAIEMQILIRNDMAVAYGNLNQWQQALALQNEAIELLAKMENPSNVFQVAPIGNHGLYLFESGHLEEAEKTLRKAIDVAGDHAEVTYYKSRMRYRLARALDFGGRFDEALAEYQLCLEDNNQEHVDAAGDAADVELKMARIYIRQGNLEQARIIIDTLAENLAEHLDQPEAWIYYQTLAALHIADADYYRAVEAGETATAKLPLDFSPHSEQLIIDYDLGRSYAVIGQLDKARAKLTNALSIATQLLGSDSYYTQAILEELENINR